MKNAFNKILTSFALLFILASGVKAAGGVSVSSVQSIAGGGPVILLQADEYVRFSITCAATGTLTMERSDDSLNWTTRGVGVSTAATGDGGISSGTVYAGTRGYYRMNLLIASTGSFTYTMSDVDDFVFERKNHKFLPILTLNDDSMVVQGSIQGTSVAATTTEIRKEVYIAGSTSTYLGRPQLQLNALSQISWSSAATNSLLVMSSTGGPIILRATPTISTQAVPTGALMRLYSTTTSITLQDFNLVANTGLDLSTPTVIMSSGSWVDLIYDNGNWHGNRSITNNRQQ